MNLIYCIFRHYRYLPVRMPNMLFFVLLFTHAALPLANSCADCIKPTHSWDALPVSLHTSEIVTNVKGEFTLKELDTIAR